MGRKGVNGGGKFLISQFNPSVKWKGGLSEFYWSPRCVFLIKLFHGAYGEERLSGLFSHLFNDSNPTKEILFFILNFTFIFIASYPLPFLSSSFLCWNMWNFNFIFLLLQNWRWRWNREGCESCRPLANGSKWELCDSINSAVSEATTVGRKFSGIVRRLKFPKWLV